MAPSYTIPSSAKLKSAAALLVPKHSHLGFIVLQVYLYYRFFIVARGLLGKLAEVAFPFTAMLRICKTRKMHTGPIVLS